MPHKNNNQEHYFYLDSNYMKTNFWTIVDGSPKERNLKEEEYKVRNDVFGSWRRREIDEAIVQYYEIYDCHSSFYKDDCIYQAKLRGNLLI